MHFQGQDEESRLFNNLNRYYQPETGRYITPDPVGMKGGLNPYVYVGGNPVGWVDPLGLFDLNNDGFKTYYRTMSQEHYQYLVDNGELLPTSETFTSPTQIFSEGYDGVLVEFKLAPGTTKSLEEIGVIDRSKLTKNMMECHI
nr:RHS repeat-associated core domain-containing protein [Phytobacter massiliensis]